jgi:hypothetical protein
MPMPTFPLARLGAFRNELHGCFSRRADALFELVVAIPTANWTNRFNDGLGTPLG